MGRKMFQASHVVKGATTGEHVYGMTQLLAHYKLDEIDLSHICHHGGCLNPDHLSFEPTSINTQERKICFHKGSCTGHIDPATKIKFPNCVLLPTKRQKERKKRKIDEDGDDGDDDNDFQDNPFTTNTQ